MHRLFGWCPKRQVIHLEWSGRRGFLPSPSGMRWQTRLPSFSISNWAADEAPSLLRLECGGRRGSLPSPSGMERQTRLPPSRSRAALCRSLQAHVVHKHMLSARRGLTHCHGRLRVPAGPSAPWEQETDRGRLAGCAKAAAAWRQPVGQGGMSVRVGASVARVDRQPTRVCGHVRSVCLCKRAAHA